MTTSGATVAIGVPLYNAAQYLPEALESLIAQTDDDLGIVLVDDCSSDATREIALSYTRRDPRVTYHRNEQRLGLGRNWRHAFDVALREHPSAQYFAWGSDHDVWNPRWLEALRGALDAQSAAVGAFPGVAKLSGNALAVRPPSATVGGADTISERMVAVSRRVRAGYVVYGLFRVDAVRRVGVFRNVLLPDRLFVSELALLGDLVSVDEVLWYKRVTGTFSVERQRRASFPDGIPTHARLPWYLTHAAVIGWDLGIRGRGGSALPRAAGLRAGAANLGANWSHVMLTRWRRRRKQSVGAFVDRVSAQRAGTLAARVRAATRRA
jgi:glycosyltransferase involved in cell wall biosynthesis